jgi:uncharacterized protein
LETAELIFKQVFDSEVIRKPVAFLWHLGEPLVRPISFYEAAFESCRRIFANRSHVHSFQTNATLLSNSWIDLIKRHRVRMGVSIDGPAFIHDCKRRTRAGHGTHAEVMRGIELLQAHGVPFSVISVLTASSLQHADAMFDFYVASGIDDVAFNIDEAEGTNTSSSFASGDDIDQAYRLFLERFLQRIDMSSGAVKVREIWKIVRCLTNGAGTIQNTTNEPFKILNVAANGDFSTYCPELLTAEPARGRSFILGNLGSTTIDEAARSSRLAAIHAEIEAGRELCRLECDHWEFCGGGSPSNKFFERGRLDVTETLTCRIHLKATADVVMNYLRQHLGAKADHAG